MPAENCPLDRGFHIRILYKKQSIPEKCPLEGGVRYRENFHCNFQIGKNYTRWLSISVKFYSLVTSVLIFPDQFILLVKLLKVNELNLLLVHKRIAIQVCKVPCF